MSSAKKKGRKFFSKEIKIKKISSFSKIEPINLKLIYATVAINLLVIVIVIIFRNNLPPEVPLYFGLPKGEDQLTTTLGLTIPSVLSFIILLINFVVSLFLKETFLKKTLIVSAFVLSLFSAITTFKIILLVGNI